MPNSTILNLVLDQGSSFEYDLYIQQDDGNALDLSDYLVTAQLRKSYDSPKYLSFSCVVDNPSSGLVQLQLTPAETFTLQELRYVFTVDITHITDGSVTRKAEGVCTVTPSANRGGQLMVVATATWNPFTQFENMVSSTAANLQSEIDNIAGASIPVQINHEGEFLTTDGTNTSWTPTVGYNDGPIQSSVSAIRSSVSALALSIIVTQGSLSALVIPAAYNDFSVRSSISAVANANSVTQSSLANLVIPSAYNDLSVRSSISAGQSSLSVVAIDVLSLHSSIGLSQSSIANLLPHPYSAGEYLYTSDGINLSWSSVSTTYNDTSIRSSLGNIQSSVASNLLTLNSAQSSIANLLPTQTGNNGKFLTTSGTTLSWSSVGSGGVSYDDTSVRSSIGAVTLDALSLHSSVGQTQSSVALNYLSLIQTQSSVANNFLTLNSAQSSIATNYLTLSSTQSSVAANFLTLTTTQSSVASNYLTLISTQSSVASNLLTLTTTQSSVASNYLTLISTQSSVASNYLTLVSSQSSVASNYLTLISTQSSVSTGYSSLVSASSALSASISLKPSLGLTVAMVVW